MLCYEGTPLQSWSILIILLISCVLNTCLSTQDTQEAMNGHCFSSVYICTIDNSKCVKRMWISWYILFKRVFFQNYYKCPENWTNQDAKIYDIFGTTGDLTKLWRLHKGQKCALRNANAVNQNNFSWTDQWHSQLVFVSYPV